MKTKSKTQSDFPEITQKLKKIIKTSLEDSKALDIEVINVFNKTDICYYMVVASGSSTRHVMNIAEKLGYAIKHSDLDVDYKIEGEDEGRWVLIDAIDIVIHVFLPEVREIYKIEEIWT